MTNMFYTYPNNLVRHNDFMGQHLGTYKIVSEIYDTEAKYWVNGELYASCDYELGKIPQKGFFGFAWYNRDEKRRVKDVKITYLKSYDERK